MTARELVVLGTASQAPTRTRNHNGYLLRWDGHGLLFDPGEGTQRQLLLAGLSVSAISRICLTHLHGDHCLGLPGVVQRLSVDRVTRPVPVHYPASGREFVARLRHASAFHEIAELVEQPVEGDGMLRIGELGDGIGTLEAHRLDHTIESYGFRLVEPDGRRMVPALLAAHGVAGPAVGELARRGRLEIGGRTVAVEQVSHPRPGQRFAFVMDTRLCDGVYALADRADLLVIESTFLDEDATAACDYGHLTAGQAGSVAASCGVRTLVLTHFSQRYTEPARFAEQAGAAFDGEIVVAADLMRVPVPRRNAQAHPLFA